MTRFLSVRTAAAQGANGPVHAVFAENWVVYTYWSAIAHRFRPAPLIEQQGILPGLSD